MMIRQRLLTNNPEAIRPSWLFQGIPSLAGIRRFLVLVLVLAALLSFGPAWAEEEQVASDTRSAASGLTYFLKVEKLNSFLDFPNAEKLEVFRRLSRKLSDLNEWFDASVLLCGGFMQAGVKLQGPFAPPVAAKTWDNPQKDLYHKLAARGESLLAAISSEVKVPAKGLVVTGLFDPAVMGQYLQEFLPRAEHKDFGGLRRKLKLQHEILPLFELVELMGLVGVLDEKGFTLRCDIQGKAEFGEAFKAYPVGKELITLGKYIDPESLLSVAHFQPPPDPAMVAEQLNQFPQTVVLKNILASANLNLEKDILPLAAEEYLVIGNLNPVSESGLPDLRLVARVRDTVKFLATIPAMRQLALNLGVFLQVNTETLVSVRVSYFLFPASAVYLSLVENNLILATSKEKLVETAQRIADVNAGKIPPFVLPAGLNRYWRVRFKDVNEQLQRLLQSPVFAGKGVPPVSNLTLTRELGDLEVLTKVLEKKIEIRVKLPIVAQP